MAYTISIDAPIADEIRRIVREQLTRGLQELACKEIGSHAAIHQVRKRLKKIRSVLRLARPALGEFYEAENVRMRDLGRGFARFRDAQAMVETVDKLADRFMGDVDCRHLPALSNRLIERRASLVDEGNGLDEQLEAFPERVAAARRRVDDWPHMADDFEPLAKGLKRTYRRGRKSAATAFRDGSSEAFHDWRKRVKYHWHHLRLLRGLWPPVITARAQSAKELADILGDEHDLALLRAWLAGNAKDRDVAAQTEIEATLLMVDRRKLELRVMAIGEGHRLYADRPGALAFQFSELWHAARGEAKFSLPTNWASTAA